MLIKSITSKQHTWLRKRLLPSDQLLREEKVKVYQSRFFPVKQVIEKKDGWTKLCLGSLGEWWANDEHWEGLSPSKESLPYVQQGDLRYIPDFPHLGFTESEDLDYKKVSLPLCFTMWLQYCNAPGISTYTDYLEVVAGCPEECLNFSYRTALSKLGNPLKFTKSADEHIVKSEIDKGNPVIAVIFANGDHAALSGFRHAVVITGYNNDSWLVHDPIGQLDLFNGGWSELGAEVGKNILYSFEGFNPRLFFHGGATGLCWLPPASM